MKNHNLPILIENKQLNKIRKLMFEPYLIHDNILVCSFFSSWCLIVLNSDYEIISKHWGEKEKILKCFADFIKNDKLNLSILGIRKIKSKVLKPFVMDINDRNSWFDWDKKAIVGYPTKFFKV